MGEASENARRGLTATTAVLALAIGIAGVLAPARAAGDIGVLLNAVEKTGHVVPPEAEIEAQCGDDIVCAARRIAETIGPSATLAQDAPGNSALRWSQTKDFDTVADLDNGILYLRPDPFDASALVEAWGNRPDEVTALVLDLRRLADETNLEGMRQVAGLLAGPVSRAFRLMSQRGRGLDWSLSPARGDVRPRRLTVWIGTETPAVGTVLAELLRVHADAQVLGEPSLKGDIVRQAVPVTRGWRLLLPRGTVQLPSLIPGQPVLPDGPIPPEALAHGGGN